MSETPRHTVHRPALIILVVVLAVAALALGWWQWERFSSASGTAQNLGYAMQWPLFAGFALFAYFRFVRLEQEAGEDVAQSAAGGSAESGTGAAAAIGSAASAPAGRDPAGGAKGSLFGRRAAAARGPREIPAGFLPERPRAAHDADPVLAEYNSYLARLNADGATAAGQAGTPARVSERSAG